MKHRALLFGCVLLTGCVHYQPQPISPEKTAAQWESRRLDDHGLKAFIEQNTGRQTDAWPETNWDLPGLTLAAFYFHPSLEVARDQWLVARAGLKTAGARPNPSVSVAPGYDSQIPGNYSPWLVPLTFDVPIETAGKRDKRLIEAGKVAESARWSFVAAIWQVRSGVRSALLDYALAGRRAELLQQEVATQQQIVKRLQERLDAGEIARPELTVMQIALNKAQLDLGDALSSRTDARSRLAEAVGLSETALDGAALSFDFSASEAEALTSAEVRQTALQTRADILGALADYAAAEADLDLEIAKQYPDLHLGPGYTWNNGNAGDSEWSLGLTLELPILDQNEGPIAEAEARRKLSAAKFVELQGRIIGEIDRALAGWRVAEAQMKAGETVLASEEQQEQATQAQLQAGAGDPLDLLNVQLELINARLAQLDNEAKRQAALGALEDVLQRPADSVGVVIEKISVLNQPTESSK